MRAYCARVVGAAICLAFSGGAGAHGEELVAANGAQLPAPPIETLACDEIQELMYLYSASGYRLSGEIPTDQPDLTLFEYENELARHHYEECHLGAQDYASPSETFGKGFN
ncbi:MAG: hypothetical protein AAGH68_15880 [Pseudomonadota bacterium]